MKFFPACRTFIAVLCRFDTSDGTTILFFFLFFPSYACGRYFDWRPRAFCTSTRDYCNYTVNPFGSPSKGKLQIYFLYLTATNTEPFGVSQKSHTQDYCNCYCDPFGKQREFSLYIHCLVAFQSYCYGYCEMLFSEAQPASKASIILTMAILLPRGQNCAVSQLRIF